MVGRRWSMAVLVPAALLAQEPEAAALADLQRWLDTPVKVASTTPTTVFYAPSTVSVLDRETLDRYGVRTLGEALEMVAGMETGRTIFRPGVPVARGVLEAGYANRVLLLINGVAAWNVATGDLALDRIPMEDVARIEVLKGPASVLYGTNAYAGAVNVVLRSPGEGGAAVRGEVQDQAGGAGGASGAFALGPLRGYVSGQARAERGEDRTTAGEDGVPFRLQDRRRQRTGTLLLQGGAHSFLANAFAGTAPYFGATYSAGSGGGRDWDERGALLSYGYDRAFGDRFRLKYGLAWDASGRTIGADATGRTAYHARGRRLVHTLATTWTLGRGFELELGGSREERKVEAFTLDTDHPLLQLVPPGTVVREDSAYGQLRAERGEWSALLGARSTHNGNFGSNLASRVTVVWAFAPQQSLKAIWGQSFRAPSIWEQYLEVPGLAHGNRDLRPETSGSAELAWLASPLDSLFVQVLAFRSTYRDMTYRPRRYPAYSSDPTDISTVYQNGPEVRTRGLELEARLDRPGGLKAFLAADWTRGEGADARLVPACNVRAGLSRDWGPLQASAKAFRQGAAEGPLGPVPAWTGADLALAWTHAAGGGRLRHQLSLRNAFDGARSFPEVTRRVGGNLPEGMGRSAAYSVAWSF